MKKRKYQLGAVLLSILMITILTTAAVSGIIAGYSVSDSASVTAVVYNPQVSLGIAIDGDNSGVIIPGGDIVLENAPTVHLDKDSSPCYIFITVDRSDNFDDYMFFTLGEGWYKHPSEEGVFFMISEETVTADGGVDYPVFLNNTIEVYNHLTRTDIAALGENKVTISVSASAVVKDSEIDTVAEAWAAVSGSNNQ